MVSEGKYSIIGCVQINVPEAIFNTEIGEYCCITEFIGDFIQGWGLLVFTDDGFI